MVSSTNHGLLYPEPSDANDYPTHMQQLAEGVDVRLPRVVADQAARDAIPSADRYVGMVVWVEADTVLQMWNGSSWVTTIITDHGQLTGLDDDDHSQYAKRAGDTFTGLVTVDGSGIHATLSDDFALDGAAPSNYPQGFTTFRDAQGSFPAGAGGIVETYNPVGAANVRQFNWAAGTNTIYTRVATSSSAWEPWLRVNHLPVARIYFSSTAQNIPDNTTTKVELDAVQYDRGGLADLANNQLVLERGIWIVTASLYFEGSSNGTSRELRIFRNGENKHFFRSSPVGNASKPFGGATIIESAGAHALELFANQNSGAGLGVLAGQGATYLAAAFLEEAP